MACCTPCRMGYPCGMQNQSAWGAMHLPDNRTRQRTMGYGQLGLLHDDEPEVHTLQPFPNGGPLIVPDPVDVEFEEQEFVTITPEEQAELDLETGKTPGAVQVRLENWDLAGEPFATYIIAPGDTFYGLAITYLGDGARAMEIYDTGNNHAIIGPDPNVIKTKGPIDMPEEARDRMKAFVSKGEPPGTTPGQIKPSEVKAIKERPTKIVVGVVAAVALAGTAFVVYKLAT